MVSKVWITKFAEKQLRKLPRNIVLAFHAWVQSVEIDGIIKTEKNSRIS